MFSKLFLHLAVEESTDRPFRTIAQPSTPRQEFATMPWRIFKRQQYPDHIRPRRHSTEVGPNGSSDIDFPAQTPRHYELLRRAQDAVPALDVNFAGPARRECSAALRQAARGRPRARPVLGVRVRTPPAAAQTREGRATGGLGLLDLWLTKARIFLCFPPSLSRYSSIRTQCSSNRALLLGAQNSARAEPCGGTPKSATK